MKMALKNETQILRREYILH